jgi:hypothetical protein
MVRLEEIYFNITGKCEQHNVVQTVIEFKINFSNKFWLKIPVLN